MNMNDVEKSSVITAFLAAATSECVNDVGNGIGIIYWTAGQRLEPIPDSTYVWRVPATDTYDETVSEIAFTHWFTGEPNAGLATGWYCIHMYELKSYEWDDNLCSAQYCAVCEVNK